MSDPGPWPPRPCAPPPCECRPAQRSAHPAFASPEQPKIRLPRHLRQTYIRRVGEPINLVIPFQVRGRARVRGQGRGQLQRARPRRPVLPAPRPQGKPRPQVVWTKGGVPVDPSRVNLRTSDTDTVFFVRQAARSDSGEYELCVQIENMKDTATISICVVGAWRGGAAAGWGGGVA